MGLMRLIDARARGIISQDEYLKYIRAGRRPGDRLVFDTPPNPPAVKLAAKPTKKKIEDGDI